ncbi:long-chain acyl-CoA synthetase [Amycolatopsis arida]|uniref:Long-chain acyl-CoA synthetase n=1 Tax=Amycolatopsis arida TaxID=587909 RepID=A0A1I5WMH3_9PSEU|nr:AMP-binding protein [Amycolatopsis arida]TDX92356.1 long-chain acyl-CoA synthetase [Amycolatopsis arida]SFQ21002.1 long-chain acyl-CoA synthetase [Amycolatopsis arida]
MPITPPGLPRSLTYPEVPVGALLAGAATRFGDRTAFAHGPDALSYTTLVESACRFAHALAARGVGRGDTVALHLPNCLTYPVAYFGTLLAGATFTPANPLLPAPALAAQLADAGARVTVTAGRAAATLAEARSATAVELTITPDPGGPGELDLAAFTADQPATPPPVAVDPADLAHLAYTGGTTGRSKGVRIPHRNVVVNALQCACWTTGCVPDTDAAGNPVLRQTGPAEEWPEQVGTGVALNLTPWFHAMGTVGSLVIPLLTGTTIVLHDRFDPPAYLADAERLRVTRMGGAPTLFAALLACPDIATRDLSAVRLVTSGAAPLPASTIRALQRHLPNAVVAEGYGLTEVTMGAVFSPAWRSGTRRPGSVGVPLFDTEVAVRPPDGTGGPLPPGTPGEVWLRGPQVMAGYHRRPDETAAVLVDGWLRTGDIGVLDADGYLSIVDRTKDMLIYKGYNVYPRQLEELLLAQAGVAAAAVVGRPAGDVGELPVAFVVRTHDGVTADELLAAVNAQVLPYQRLRELRFVESIPVSAAGKVLKRELRERLGATRLG